jgi:RraA family protein
LIGFRIGKRSKCASADLLRRFASVQTANLSDCMNRLFDGPGLKPFHSTGTVVGTAFTVRVPPGDNLMVHKALDLAGAGDVVVVDAGGQLTQAIVGELMVLHAQQRGLAGIVIYGAVRDSATLRKGKFPVYALGVTHRGPYKNGPGEINYPISLGGMVVEPGDVILGDEDGLLSVPLTLAEDLLAMVTVVTEKEAKTKQAIAADKNDRRWVDETLRARGYDGPLP